MKKVLPKILGSLALFIVGLGLTFAVFLAVRKRPWNGSNQRTNVNPSDVPGLSVGDSVDFPELSTIDGNAISLKQLKEKNVLCVIFTTECPGCAKDSEMWRDLSAEAAKRKVAFYVISFDEDQSRVKRFALAYGFDDLQVFFDPHRTVARAFRIKFVPQYILMTSGGKVIGRWNGVQNYDAAKHDFRKLDHFFEPITSN
jgi:peroxiredoxin